jgi:hypothetical protein
MGREGVGGALLLHTNVFRTLSLVPAEEEEKSLLGKLLQPLAGTKILFSVSPLSRLRINDLFCYHPDSDCAASSGGRVRTGT